MNRVLWCCIVSSFVFQFHQAQVLDSIASVTEVAENTVRKDTIIETIIPDVIKPIEIDSLVLRQLYSSNAMDSLFNKIKLSEVDRGTISEWNDLPTDTLKQRLTYLNSITPFDIEYNPELERVIKSYLKYRRSSYPTLMARSGYYFPLFEQELSARGMPLELKYLPIVESALRPKAVSGAGATGLWQFMYPTGKMYKLEVNSYVDDRQDPVKSTKAACDYLQDLYHMFNDWDLALAAYNSGMVNVSKAIKRSGNHTNYWNIRPYLPRETANYLPAFYASMYIFEFAEKHHLYTNKPTINRIEVDTIRPRTLLTFEQIQEKTGIDIELLEFLNPSYKLNIVPKVKGKDYSIVLPVKKAMDFVTHEEEIYAAVKAQDSLREKPLPKFFELNQRTKYRVKSGDILGTIAAKHGVSIKNLKKWNRLKSSKLNIGDRLVIYPKRVAQTTNKKEKVKKPIEKVVIPKGAKKIYHTIVEGDNLWDIARKYNVSVSYIRGWNDLWKSNNLKLNRKLVIYKSES